MKNDKKVVVITGVSSGIGEACVSRFLDAGYTVYGFGRKDYHRDGLHYSKLDITKPDGVRDYIDSVIADEGKIDILISNVGMGISGPVEEATVSDIQQITNVNFLGSVYVIQAVLPHMRRQGFGTIVCISSVGSFVPLPFQAFYSATKSALDTLVDATRSEVKQFGVKIVCVHPGDVKTGFTGARHKQNMDENNPYKNVCEHCVSAMERDEQSGMTPDYVASKIYKVATKRNPKLRNVIGGKYKLFTFLLNIMPRRMREWAVRKMYF